MPPMSDGIFAMVAIIPASIGLLPTPVTTIEALDVFLDRGLIDLDDSLLTIRPDGLPYGPTVCALLDRHRPQTARRFSSAV